MNKLELIKTLRNECQISKKEAATVVDLFFNEMANALAKGDRVEIRGLCSFYVKKYKAYAGRNPKTGVEIENTKAYIAGSIADMQSLLVDVDENVPREEVAFRKAEDERVRAVESF